MATSTTKPVEQPSIADSKAEKPEDTKESATGYEEGQDDEFEDFPRHLQGMSRTFPPRRPVLPSPVSLLPNGNKSTPTDKSTPGLTDWADSETEAANQKNAGHLWDESWDDDDTSSDFSAQLREELKKVEASKKK
jgi:hypothetical protein